jgi:hypothetical protein
MRTLLICLLIQFVCSCGSNKITQDKSNESQKEYRTVKNNLLFVDSQDNIYLRHKVNIMQRNPSASNDNYRYFDMLVCGDTVYYLTSFIDIATFVEIDSCHYEDKIARYFFNDHPASFPAIIAERK